MLAQPKDRTIAQDGVMTDNRKVLIGIVAPVKPHLVQHDAIDPGKRARAVVDDAVEMGQTPLPLWIAALKIDRLRLFPVAAIVRNSSRPLGQIDDFHRLSLIVPTAATVGRRFPHT